MQIRRPASDRGGTSRAAPYSVLAIVAILSRTPADTAAASAPRQSARKSRPASAAPLLKSRVCGLRFRTIHGRYAANSRIATLFRQRSRPGSWLQILCHAYRATPRACRVCAKFARWPRGSLRRGRRFQTCRISRGAGTRPPRGVGRKRRRGRSAIKPGIRKKIFDRVLTRNHKPSSSRE